MMAAWGHRRALEVVCVTFVTKAIAHFGRSLRAFIRNVIQARDLAYLGPLLASKTLVTMISRTQGMAVDQYGTVAGGGGEDSVIGIVIIRYGLDNPGFESR
jgi:hypothetical protein